MISLTFELIVHFIIRLLMVGLRIFFEFSLSSCFREVRRPGVIQGLSGELILFILIRNLRTAPYFIKIFDCLFWSNIEHIFKSRNSRRVNFEVVATPPSALLLSPIESRIEKCSSLYPGSIKFLPFGFQISNYTKSELICI